MLLVEVARHKAGSIAVHRHEKLTVAVTLTIGCYNAFQHRLGVCSASLQWVACHFPSKVGPNLDGIVCAS